MSNIEQLSENIYLGKIPGTHDAAIIHLSEGSSDAGLNKTTPMRGLPNAGRIRYWGERNDLPQVRQKLIADNNVVGTLIGTKRNIILGGGLIAYTETYDQKTREYIKLPVDMPDEAAKFFEDNDIEDYLEMSANNLLLQGQFMTEMIRGKRGNGARRIVRVNGLPMKYCRAQEQNERGEIPNWYFSTQWVKERGKMHLDRNIEAIPNLTRGRMRDIRRRISKGDTIPFRKIAWRVGDHLFSDGYYYEPPWWGGREWIELANCIPEFHRANLKHGYTIRYQIMYRSDYFNVTPEERNSEEARKQAKKEAKKRKDDFIDKMNDFLAGLANTGRAVYTKYDFDKGQMKEIPGIIIKPINVDLQDEALLELFEKSNQANISAQAIHPTLANIETQGKLSSGSEMRIALQVYLAIHAPLPRRLLLRPIEMISKINGWDQRVKFGFRDMRIVTLDEDKEGYEQGGETE